jgi:hypothetical protein
VNAYDPFYSYSVAAFFHFTDMRNVPSIKKLGGLYSLRELRKRGIEITSPGGNEWSHDADVQRGLDQYVHLCFRDSHPMEYLARKDGRIKDSIFLSIHPDVRRFEGVRFSADVSNKSGVPIHTVQDAVELIDFEVLYTKTDWHDSAIKARLQAAQKCELLVPDHIPLKYLQNCPHG